MTRLFEKTLLILAFGLLAIQVIARDAWSYLTTGRSYNDSRSNGPSPGWIAAEAVIAISLGVVGYVAWVVVGMMGICGHCGMGW
jgi:hypothetical protein